MLKNKQAELATPVFSVVEDAQQLADVEPIKLFPKVSLPRVSQQLKRDVLEAIKLFLFEVNDARTRSYLTGLLKLRFSAYQKNKCLSAFEIVCNESNNPPSVVDANDIRIDVWVQLGDATEQWTHNVHGWTRKL